MARYFRRGVSKLRFLPACAGASPTRAEITAGTDLTASVADISGMQFSNSPIAVPDLNSTFTSQINGEDTVADTSVTFYDDDTTHTVRTALAKGTAGFLLLLPYGDVATKRCEVWPVVATGVNDEWTTGNDSARFSVGFAITGVPKQNATVPAQS